VCDLPVLLFRPRAKIARQLRELVISTRILSKLVPCSIPYLRERRLPVRISNRHSETCYARQVAEVLGAPAVVMPLLVYGSADDAARCDVRRPVPTVPRLKQSLSPPSLSYISAAAAEARIRHLRFPYHCLRRRGYI
jgi:hypothetical protein